MVKGKQFNSWRSIGHASQAAKIYAARSVDELCILDISATVESRRPDLALVRELSEWCFSPLTIGGGVRNVEDVTNLLNNGADKVAINTAACDSPWFIEECAKRFGSQAITVSIDYSRVKFEGGVRHCVSSRAGTNCVASKNHDCNSPMDPELWAKHMEGCGAGEILLTCIDREGMMEGYDLETVRRVVEAVEIPVIAHGGCGSPRHCLEAIQAGADAVAVGSMFAFTDDTPKSVAKYLKDNGIEVRYEP